MKLFPNVNFYTYYGLTEASRSTFMLFNKNPDKLDSVGKPAPNVEIQILDENKKILNPYQVGEISIRGNHVIENYWNNPNADKQIENGWLRTDDLGYFDADGFLYLKGRKDDLINVGGDKFSPEEVEIIIREINGISDVAVVGMPNKIFGQIPVAFVVSNTKNIDPSYVINYCSKKLERHKIPQKIKFVDAIPKTESGKIKRNELKSNSG